MELKITIFMILLLVTYVLARGAYPKIDESFFISQAMREKFINITLKHEDREDDLVSDWSEENNTNLSKPIHPHIVYQCPLKYVVVYNPNRIPDTMIEAVCISNQCNIPGKITTHHDNSPKRLSLKESKCETVEYVRWVKVRSHRGTNGKWTYLRRLLPVAVACTCNSKYVKQLE